MADFHFFSDLHLMHKQTGHVSTLFGLPYGPVEDGVGNTDELKYAFCPASLHYAKKNITQNPKAYAICDGMVFFIEVPGTEDGNGVNQLVDAIFLPAVQSEVNPRIKYFVYRSILRSSLVHMATQVVGPNTFDQDDILSPDLPSNGVDIIAIANQANLDNGGTLPTKGSIIGITPGGINDFIATNPDGFILSSDSFLDDIFHYEWNNDSPVDAPKYSGFSVSAGDVIGLFPKQEEFGSVHLPNKNRTMVMYGLQILKDRRGFEPKISDIIGNGITSSSGSVKAAVNRLVSLDFDAGVTSDFEKETQAEQSLNFMDPAAFYGNFAHASHDVLHLTDIASADDDTVGTRSVPSSNYVIAGASYEEQAQIEIYQRLMLGTGEGINGKLFKNKNRVYIELLDERGNSHNYFHQFGDETFAPISHLKDIRIEWNTNPGIQEVKSSKNGISLPNRIYPVFVVDSGYSAFPTDQHVDQNEFVTLDLEFKKTQHFGACYSVYAHSGKFNRSTIKTANLLEDPDSKFTFLSGPENTDYSDPIQFRILHYLHSEGLLGSNKTNFPIAQHISITVVKNQEEIQDPPPKTPLDAGYTHGTTPNLRDLEYLDNLWCPFEYRMQIPLKLNSTDPQKSTNLQVRTCRESAYWNNTQADGLDYLADTGLAIEYDDVGQPLFYTLFANAYESRTRRFDTDETGRPINQVSLVPNNANVFSEVSRASSFIDRVATSTLRPFQLAVDAVEDFTDPGTGNTPNLRNLIVNPRARAGAVIPPAGIIRKFTSGFTSIRFTAAEWTALTNIYEDTFLDGSGSPLVKGSRVYMSFKNDGVYLDANNKQFIRFKVILRGFVLNGTSGNVELVDVDQITGFGPIYHYICYDSHDASQNANIIRLASPTPQGSGHIVHLQPGDVATYNVPYPVGGTIPKAGIEAHMHFARGIGMTWLDLRNLRDAVIENINLVWDSHKNCGMWQINDPDPNLGPVNYKNFPYSLQDIKDYPDDSDGNPGSSNLLRLRIRPEKPPLGSGPSDGITCSVACPSHYSYISPGQSLITAVRDLFSQRSHITSRRTGLFYCQYPPALENDPNRDGDDILTASDKNVFAHEFGHLMGLDDRYCFYGREYTGTNGHTVAPEGGYALAALYISNAVDSEYHNDYRWRYNLMSFASGVPDDDSSLADSNFLDSSNTPALEPAFENEYINYCKNNFLPLTNSDKGFVFITTKQWLHVKEYTNESGFFGGTALFFKHLAPPDTPNTDNEFDRSFAGFVHESNLHPGDCELIVTDDKLDVPVGSSFTSMDARRNPTAPREGGINLTFWGWVQGNNLIELNRSPIRIQDAVTGGASSSLKDKITALEIDDIIDDEPLFNIDMTIPFPVPGGTAYPNFYDYYDADTPDVNLIGGPTAACPTPGNPTIHSGDPINNRGVDLWEAHVLSDPNSQITDYPPFADPGDVLYPGIVRYNNHYNREEIIKIIGGLSAG